MPSSINRGQAQVNNDKHANRGVRLLVITAISVFAILFILFFASLLLSNFSDSTTPEQNAPQTEAPDLTRPNQTNSNPFAFDMERILRQREQDRIQREREAEQAKAQEKEVFESLLPEPESEKAKTFTQILSDPFDEDIKRRLGGSVAIEFYARPNPSANRSTNARGSTLSDKFTRANTPAVKAYGAGDGTYRLGKGTNISCTLHTKIVTTHPGFTRCIVNKDVYSENGRTLLIERGSTVIGEQASLLKQGQARIFVMWHTILTPYGVKMEIDSPTADPLGGAGQPARIDQHFWQRFGGAILLSTIDDVLGIVTKPISNKDYSFSATTDNLRSLSEEALRDTTNIPPTGYVDQGALLNIISARDIDFSPMYQLERKK